MVPCPSTPCPAGIRAELRCFGSETQESRESPGRVEAGRELWRSPGPTCAQAGSPRAGCPRPSPGEFWVSAQSGAMRSKPGQEVGRAGWPGRAEGPSAARHLQLAVPCSHPPCTLLVGQFLQTPRTPGSGRDECPCWVR